MAQAWIGAATTAWSPDRGEMLSKPVNLSLDGTVWSSDTVVASPRGTVTSPDQAALRDDTAETPGNTAGTPGDTVSAQSRASVQTSDSILLAEAESSNAQHRAHR